MYVCMYIHHIFVYIIKIIFAISTQGLLEMKRDLFGPKHGYQEYVKTVVY